MEDKNLIKAKKLYEEGKIYDAILKFKSCLKKNKNSAESNFGLAISLAASGNVLSSLEFFKAARDLNPRNPVFSFNHANALRLAGKLPDAIDAYTKTLQLAPDFMEARQNIAAILMEQSQEKLAIPHLKILTSNSSSNASYWAALAKAYVVVGNIDDALLILDKAIRHFPKNPGFPFQKGGIYTIINRFDMALPSFAKAVELAPNWVDAWISYGKALRDAGLPAEAIKALRTAVELQPDQTAALSSLLQIKRQSADWDDLQTVEARFLDAINRGETRGALLFSALNDPTTEAQQLALAKANHPKAKSDCASVHVEPREGNRIRVAYLSNDFFDHATTRLIVETIENHDRNRFEIALFSWSYPDGSDLQKRLIAASEHYIDISSSSIDETVETVRRFAPDIAVDLKGYTAGERMDLFARRLAPVQVNWLGYPGTLGTEYHDYIIADDITIPVSSEPFYTEKVIRLRCYQPTDTKRSRPKLHNRAEYGLPEEAIVLCAFNQLHKLRPEIFDIWCRALHNGPRACLWLYEASGLEFVRANLLRQAHIRGIDESRIVFAGKLPQEDHLARYALADIFLDTTPYGAHTTASDALWMGCPLLTIRGETMASRVSSSILRAVGLSQLSCPDLDAYERTLLRLLDNPEEIQALKNALSQPKSLPLFDNMTFTRDLERAYEKMLEA